MAPLQVADQFFDHSLGFALDDVVRIPVGGMLSTRYRSPHNRS
ncbi:MAG: hypothetical protein WBX50_08250 [Candidatus Deferrimicrobiaceae bacterium]